MKNTKGKNINSSIDPAFNITIANEKHLVHIDDILDTIAEAAEVRGTGIARRPATAGHDRPQSDS